MGEGIFDRIEKKTNVKKEDILNKLIRDVARLAGKDVSKEKEQKIIDSVKNDKVPKNMNNIIK